MSAPLEGIRVLEVSEGVAGPMAGRLLGDAGADVIKVEGPDGDRARGWGTGGSTGVIFRALNRNKRSVTAELDGLDGLSGLLESADVLLTDSGILDVDEVMAGHSQLVVCVISDWGPEGPWAALPGGELPAQLASEATASLGKIGEEPVRLGNEHAGMVTGSYAMQAIVAALLVRPEVGGQRIDLSLFGTLLQMRSTLWVAHSNPDEWWGFHLDSYVKPPEHGYSCKDGRIYFSVGRADDRSQLLSELKMDFAREDPRWEIFSKDSGGGTGRYSHLVHDIWDRGLSQWTVAEAKEILERHGCWVFPYFTYQQFLDDEHVQGMGLVVDVEDGDGALRRDLRPPWQFSETPAVITRRAPELGEHTEEILVSGGGRWA